MSGDQMGFRGVIKVYKSSYKFAIPLLFASLVVSGELVKSQEGHDAIAKKFPPLIAKIVSGVPFSFVYDGKPSQDLLASWKRAYRREPPTDATERQITTYSDPATGLEVSSEIKLFQDSDAVECLVRLRNTGAKDSSIIEKILPLDLKFMAPGTGGIVLHSAQGSLGKLEDYSPIDQEVVEGQEFSHVHYVLRGANHVGGQLPFFDLDWQDGGLIGAVGWSGQWLVRTSRSSGRELTLQVGQQTTHLKLHPGESIRTPRILLLPWLGNDRVAGHNKLRRILLAHYVARSASEVMMPPVGNSNAFVYEYEKIAKKTGKNPLEAVREFQTKADQDFLGGLANDALNWVNEKNQLDFIRGIPPVGVEVYWLDAGWFPGEWPFGVGSWVPDPKKFPHGIKQLGDAAHAKGLKFLLWFEPGRVGSGSLIDKQHPEWVLHRPDEGKLGGLFNFGNPLATQWMTNLLSNRIATWGIDIYRQDSNICPLPYWQTADSRDREGMAEIRWVEGLYFLWDGLLKKHPGLMIDNANWRITGPDIEVMSRSAGSLTRSETECGGVPHPIAAQMHTAELSSWVPFHMGAVNGFDTYTFRSSATMGVGTGLDLRAPYIPVEQVKRGIEELKTLRQFWLGDYYPLTEINQDERAWIGWQFHRPDLKAGFAVFFRRPKSAQANFDAGLRGLNPKANYQVSFAETYDTKDTRVMSGEELEHLRVGIGSAPGSLLIRYRIAPVRLKTK